MVRLAPIRVPAPPWRRELPPAWRQSRASPAANASGVKSAIKPDMPSRTVSCAPPTGVVTMGDFGGKSLQKHHGKAFIVAAAEQRVEGGHVIAPALPCQTLGLSVQWRLRQRRVHGVLQRAVAKDGEPRLRMGCRKLGKGGEDAQGVLLRRQTSDDAHDERFQASLTCAAPWRDRRHFPARCRSALPPAYAARCRDRPAHVSLLWPTER